MMNSSLTKMEALVERPLGSRMEILQRGVSKAMQWRMFGLSLLASDFVMLLAASRLAFFVRFEAGLPIFQLYVVANPVYYFRLLLILAPIWMIIYAVLGLYKRENLLGGVHEYSLVFRGTTIGLLLVFVAGFLQPELVIARGWMLSTWGFSFLLVSFGRFWLRRAVYSLRSRGYFLAGAVIIGVNAEACSLAEQLTSWTRSGLHLLGFIHDTQPVGSRVFRRLSILGSTKDLESILQTYDVEEIILATSALRRDDILGIFSRYGVRSDVNVRLSSGLFEIITTGLNVKEFAYVPLVGVNRVRLTGTNRVMKLLLDYGLTIPVLVLISPVLLLLAVLVRLGSKGPIIYRRRVMGVNGRQFDAFKFRTMYSNGDAILEQHPRLKEELARNHKLKDDPRVTPIGRFMRRYSLDELPQLFNVLRREMSLAGPRMISPQEVPMYNQWAINLLTVPPGITGLWQVSGRSDVSYEERVRMDMYYIRNWTIWLDLQLLWQTVPVVLRGRGAY